jgi:hypothetical protein
LSNKHKVQRYTPSQRKFWADHWLQRLRQLPRLVTKSEVDSLKLLLLGGSESQGISDGAARIRYLVGAKLSLTFSLETLSDAMLENALHEVFTEGETAGNELSALPGLKVGIAGQRAPTANDLQRMGLEYKSGFALSPLTTLFCTMHAIQNGPSLFAALEDKGMLASYLTTIAVITSGRSEP